MITMRLRSSVVYSFCMDGLVTSIHNSYDGQVFFLDFMLKERLCYLFYMMVFISSFTINRVILFCIYDTTNADKMK